MFVFVSCFLLFCCRFDVCVVGCARCLVSCVLLLDYVLVVCVLVVCLHFPPDFILWFVLSMWCFVVGFVFLLFDVFVVCLIVLFGF